MSGIENSRSAASGSRLDLEQRKRGTRRGRFPGESGETALEPGRKESNRAEVDRGRRRKLDGRVRGQLDEDRGRKRADREQRGSCEASGRSQPRTRANNLGS